MLKTKPKPLTSQKKMVQYSNSDKTCLQSEKDGSILSAKTCHESEKGDKILKQSHKLSPVRKKMVEYSNRAKTCHQSEKDGAILKQCQNMLTVRKRWFNTQIEPKPVTSQKKMVQY